MTTSQKTQNFISEPIGDKAVTEIPGIGEVLGRKLSSKGFDKAYLVFGQFLLLRKDEEIYTEWIKDMCGANAKQARDSFNALNNFAEAFIV